MPSDRPMTGLESLGFARFYLPSAPPNRSIDHLMSNTPSENQPSESANRPSIESAPPPNTQPTTWSPVADAMMHGLPSPTTKQGNPIDPKDPGSPTSRLIAVLLTVLFTIIVVGWQNTSDDWKYNTLLGHPQEVIAESPDRLAPGSFGQVDLAGRLFLRGFEMFQNQPVMSQIDVPGVPQTDEDRIRIIMLTGEFIGDDAAMEKVLDFKAETLSAIIHGEDVQAQQNTNDLIIAELNTLETLYTYGLESLEQDQIDQLKARYGLIGKVAMTHGLENDHPQREPLINGFGMMMLFFLLVGSVVLIGPLLGLILLIFGVVRFATGSMKMKSHVPSHGGSVFLETYALFVGGFIVLLIGSFFVADKWPTLAPFSLLVQWTLTLLVFWGIVRGMRVKAWRKAIGWHTGEGVFKEIGCGIVAYLASVPIYIIGVGITVILLIVQGMITAMNTGGDPEPVAVSNPIFEMVASGDLVTIFMLYALTTIWAPITEETIFRGALFRHLRGKTHWVFAGILSAFLFAFMHNYGPLLVAPLIALGFMFAFMREWRGSLIAPMTAHFLHNFTLISFMILLVQLIKDPM